MGLVEQGIALLGSLINLLTPFVEKMIAVAERFMKSPFMKGVKNLFGKDSE